MLASPDLRYPTAVRVAGDDRAGFYRSEYQDHRPWDGVEAFSWGGLTSGGSLRALWLLLTPFMLANVAFWTASVPLGVTTTDKPSEQKGSRWPPRLIVEIIQRLLALALTAAFVLGVVTAAMDVVGWQYVRSTASQTGSLSFLRWSWLNEPNRELAVTAIAPLLAVGLLWFLGHQTWAKLESVTPKFAEPEGLVTPLEDRAMWNGQGPVARLRAVHVSFGVAMVGLALLAPLLLDPKGGLRSLNSDLGAPWGWAIVVLGGGLTALSVGLVIMVCLRSMSQRTRPPYDLSAGRVHSIFALLPWIAIALTALVVLVLMLPGVWIAFWPNGTSGSLPGIVGALEILFAVQATLILVLGIVVWTPRRTADQEATVPKVEGTPSGEPMNLRPLWQGVTPAFLSVIAWLLGGGFSAALTLLVIKSLGLSTQSSAAPPAGSDAIIVPAPFVWAAAATLIVAFGAIIILIGTSVRVRRDGGQVKPVETAYAPASLRTGDAGSGRERVRSIAWSWTLGHATNLGPGAVGTLIVLMSATAAAGIVGYVLDRGVISRNVSWSYNVGAVVILAGVGLLITLGRRAYQDPGTRRQVGILWDLGTFWPRATHPLAPPCYAERAVPDLIARIEYFRRADSQRVPPEGLPILLSCHSQGCVIGAATILQLRFEDSEHLAFLTYGNPLRRLYARAFPAYFGARTLARVGVLIRKDGDAKDSPITARDGERARWRWRNLYRPSDPIGGPMFVDYPAATTPPKDVDRNLLDPVSFDKPPGDSCYPAVAAHSDYLVDPAYPDAVATLNDLLS
jgi:hypothetical protein